MLYELHVKAVLTYHARRTSCAQTAADLTAEIFAQVFSSRHRYRDTGAPARAWLFAIAKRQFARYLRREEVSQRYRRRLGIEPMVLSDEDFQRVEELADLSVLRPEPEDAIASLPTSQAEALRLRIGCDLPYDVVAGQLGSSSMAGNAHATSTTSSTTTSARIPNPPSTSTPTTAIASSAPDSQLLGGPALRAAS